MNFINKALALTLMVIMTLLASVSVAQNQNESNLTHSPYSRYGYGKLGSLGNAATRGMGEVGIAIRNSNYTTIANPASLTSIDTLTMIFSVGLDADYSVFRENGATETNWDAGFSYMSFHFPLWKDFAMSLSLSPYSMVGYSYGNVTEVPVQSPVVKHDTLDIATVYNGLGGINNFMMGIGYRPWKTKMAEVNVGANVGFLFGTIRNSATVTTTSQSNSYLVTHELTTKGLFLQFGAQYTRRLNATRAFTVGATFQPKLNLSIDSEDIKLSTDTITFKDEFRNDIKSPMKMGIGFTYEIYRKLMVSAEYEFTQWSKVSGFKTDLTASSDVFTDTHRVAIGAEYIPQANSNKFFKACRYRAGFKTRNGYARVGESTTREYEGTLGLSMPVNRRCFLDFSVGFNHFAPSRNDILKEDYIKFSLGITFNEMMFFRNKLR